MAKVGPGLGTQATFEVEMAMKQRFVFLLILSFNSDVLGNSLLFVDFHFDVYSELWSLRFLAHFLAHIAGTFMAGSIRWQRVDRLQVRFDVVTYWTKSFSIYNNPQPGQEALVALTAQNTVQFDPGDGSPARYLKANVTDVSNEEDWFSAVSIVYHTYPRVP
jgi:hypothetical protein